MATTITIKVNTVEESYESPIADAQTANIIRWMLHDHPARPPEGLTQAQTNRWWLREYLKELARYTRTRAAENLRRIREMDEAVQTQIETDTGF